MPTDNAASADKIKCLECGRFFQFLPPHIVRTHGMACEDYREKHGLARGFPLAADEYREIARERANTLGFGEVGAATRVPGANRGNKYEQRKSVKLSRSDDYQKAGNRWQAGSAKVDRKQKRIELAAPWPASIDAVVERLGCTRKAAQTFLSFYVKCGKLKRLSHGIYDLP